MEDSLDSFAVDSDSVPFASMPDDSTPQKEALEEPNSPFEWDHPSLSPMSESEMPVEETNEVDEVQHSALGNCGKEELTNNNELELQDISDDECSAVNDGDLKKVNGKDVCEDSEMNEEPVDSDGHVDSEEVCAEENEGEADAKDVEEQEEGLEEYKTEVQEDDKKEGEPEDTEEIEAQGDAEEVGDEEIVEEVGEQNDVGKLEIVEGMGEQDVVEEVVLPDEVDEKDYVDEQDDAIELGGQSDEGEAIEKKDNSEETTGEKENVEEVAKENDHVTQETEKDNVEKESEQGIQKETDKQTDVGEKTLVVTQMKPEGKCKIIEQTNPIQEQANEIGEMTATSELEEKGSTGDIIQVIDEEMDVIVNGMEGKEQISLPENDQEIIESLVNTMKSTVEKEESLKEKFKTTLNFDWFKDELKEVSVKKLKIDFKLKVFNDLSKITNEILKKEKKHKPRTVKKTKSINSTIKSKRVRTPKKVFEEEYKPSYSCTYRSKISLARKKRIRLFQDNSKSVDNQRSSTRKKRKRPFQEKSKSVDTQRSPVKKQQHCGSRNKSYKEKEPEEQKLINGGKLKTISSKRKSCLSSQITHQRDGRFATRKSVKWSGKMNDSDPLFDTADNEKTATLKLNQKKIPRNNASLAKEVLQCSVKVKPLALGISTVGKELMRCFVDLEKLPEHLVPAEGRVLKLPATLIKEFRQPARKLKLVKTLLKHEASVLINVNPLGKAQLKMKKPVRKSLGKKDKKAELIHQKNKAKSDEKTVLRVSKRITTSYKKSNR